MNSDQWIPLKNIKKIIKMELTLLSHHLGTMEKAKLILRRKKGIEVEIKISPEAENGIPITDTMGIYIKK